MERESLVQTRTDGEWSGGVGSKKQKTGDDTWLWTTDKVHTGAWLNKVVDDGALAFLAKPPKWDAIRWADTGAEFSVMELMPQDKKKRKPGTIAAVAAGVVGVAALIYTSVKG